MKNLVLHGLFNYIVATVVLFWTFYRLTLLILIEGKAWLNTPASLIVTENELVNQLNFYSSGIIEFEEIKETKIVNSKGKQYLLVLLKQPQKIFTGKSTLKRILLNKALKQFGTPTVFPSDQIDYDLQKLQTILNTYLNKTPN